MNFCSACGAPTQIAIPSGDDRERWVCSKCARIFYTNPKLVVGCLPYREGRVLLCRRAIEPRRGWWTLPAGYLELGETLEEGALRETREEAGADVTLGRMFSAYTIRHIAQVYILFLAHLESEALDPGPETEEAAFFPHSEIPWGRIAFSAVEFTLRRFLESPDPATGEVHLGAFHGEPGGAWTESEEEGRSGDC